MKVADLFCGAGGSSTGAAHAISALGRRMDLVAVNHWPVAIETHTANHPGARHYCVDLDAAKPEELVPGRYLDLMLASPECTHHSRARGGKPVSDQKRASAWHVPRWAERLYIRHIIVENVPEFLEWGPLDRKGRPLQSRKGEIFKAWIVALESLGYKVEWRILNAADFGDATTRKRLFVMARRDGRRVAWPEPSHSRRREGHLFSGDLKPWCAAREVIDWAIEGKSIFERIKPLSPKTLRRIEAGLRKYCSPELAESFIVVLRRHADARSVNDPLPTICAGGQHIGIATPFVMPYYGDVAGRSRNSRSVDEPLATVTTENRFGIVEPFVCANRENNVPKSVDEPIPTATSATGGGMFLVEPFVLGQHGGATARDTGEPLPTVTTDGAIRLVVPFIVPQHGDGTRSVDDPTPTITTTSRGVRLIEPFVIDVNHGGERRPKAVTEPLQTVTAKRGNGLVEPFITPQFGEREKQKPRTHSVKEPLPAVTSHGAGALVDPRIVYDEGGKCYVLDIRFRMLQPHELAAAMGFDPGYIFTGTKENVTKQIGNAVPVNLSAALVAAALA